jgi:hypothetical protein
MAGASLSLLNLDDELNRLDAAAGDGDLGNTVTLAAQAVRASIRALAADALA